MFRRELKMPKILENNPSSSAHNFQNVKSPTSISNNPIGRTFDSSFQQQPPQEIKNALNQDLLGSNSVGGGPPGE
jgi:hypothetical protein